MDDARIDYGLAGECLVYLISRQLDV